MKPKKFLGQHFLKDLRIAERIVETLEAPTDAQVIEIGPGMGVLTQFLIPKYPQLLLVEVDEEAVEYLHNHFLDNCPPIRHVDVLKWQLSADIPTQAHFIGNLPYNISSPIFFKLLEQRDKVASGVFMIQKEVAKRICSPKGSKQYGILSVLMGYYYELKYEFSVSPGVFFPPPKVVSGVMSMKRREMEEEISFQDLKRVVKAAFQQRRKTLRNAFKPLSFEPFEEQAQLWKMRAEQLDIAEFVKIAQHLQKPA